MKKIVVVTGAASGIGRAIANRIALENPLIIVDLNAELLVETEKSILELGGTVKSLVGDIAKRSTHSLAIQEADSLGVLTGWVNCAGIGGMTPLHKMPEDPTIMSRIFEINQMGTFWGCAEAVSHFIARKSSGSIVNISSVHGRRAYKDHAIYEMTKAAIDALTRNIAVVYGPYGIRANSVAPGAIMTEAMKQSFIDAPDPEARKNELRRVTPLKRIGDPGEIAEVVEFLISGRSSYLTGQSICVDGGWTSALGNGDLDNELAKSFNLDQKTGLKKL
jgi:NAD(P)-dependent dehydrogenase (short-subunit alcohol dehydrogenase family)